MTTVRPFLLAGAAAIAIVAILAGRALWPVSAAGNSVTPASNVAVNCEPGQQALVRQTVVKGEPHVAIQCASTSGAVFANYDGMSGATAGNGFVGGEPRLIPASYVVAEPPAPRVVRTAAPTVSRTAPVRSATRTEGRSWKKTALVIGGSAGAGAGIGALIGGKKGALIGAAVGGGGAGLYEALKR